MLVVDESIIESLCEVQRDEWIHQSVLQKMYVFRIRVEVTDGQVLDFCVGLHYSSPRHAITNFTMPAMSPTMTEGGISSWKMKEGESFSAGDVFLEIVRHLNIYFPSLILKNYILARKRIKRQ